jgi:hypothetical protein
LKHGTIESVQTRCKLFYCKTTPQNSTNLSHNLQEEIHQTVGENHIRIQNLKITKAEKPMASLSKQGPKTVTAKTKIQSKSRKDQKKKARKKALNATDLSRCKPDCHRGAEIYSATRISRRRCGD